MIDLCKDCVGAKENDLYCTYSFTCFDCRQRFLLNESCKLMREIYSKSMERWGESPKWKVDPSCGCKGYCVRRQWASNSKQEK